MRVLKFSREDKARICTLIHYDFCRNDLEHVVKKLKNFKLQKKIIEKILMCFCLQSNAAGKMSILAGRLNMKTIEEILGYSFKERSFLLQAFTHSSYMPNTLTDSYERLEVSYFKV